MKMIVLSSLLLLLAFGHCNRSRDHIPLVGKYDLQGHDYSGKLILRAQFLLQI
jgi:hypothetical protein